MLCMRTSLQPRHREPKNLKELLNNRYESTEQQCHGVCEYMGATHSSQHTAPDEKHSSTRCCQTHEMWELPTPLIVANRSQQGDEEYRNYPLVLNMHHAEELKCEANQLDHVLRSLLKKKKIQVISTVDESINSRYPRSKKKKISFISTVDESIDSRNSRKRRSVDGAGTKKFSRKLQLDFSR
ncbi:hypothetical protein F511_41437 [Dorcoceras hygrometricum]|uniref:Uncharacterized protein n=1 Tax=Dorcoceras hygrometricum TaxID=472368 RepID=A0A2Z7CMP8_9LAMI|nr:hypothetical protein F511_41437 [Dorcoceras hygrometricum]